MTAPRKPSLREEQDRLCPPHWAEAVGIILFAIFFGIVLALNVPGASA